jgi:hypothetical protein
MLTELSGGFCYLCDSAYEEMSAEHYKICPKTYPARYPKPEATEAYKAWMIDRTRKESKWECECEFPQIREYKVEHASTTDLKMFVRCDVCDRRIYVEFRPAQFAPDGVVELVPIKKEGS